MTIRRMKRILKTARKGPKTAAKRDASEGESSASGPNEATKLGVRFRWLRNSGAVERMGLEEMLRGGSSKRASAGDREQDETGCRVEGL